VSRLLPEYSISVQVIAALFRVMTTSESWYPLKYSLLLSKNAESKKSNCDWPLNKAKVFMTTCICQSLFQLASL
jgi:hypothetical protein